MAEKRKSLSKRTRFEVFKRDSFRCQYCGRSSPDVILEVDHVVPVAEGGDNSLLNLITACRDCNRGKSDKRLTDKSAVERQKKQLDDLNLIREQTEMMIRWKQELMQVEEDQVDAIEDVSISVTGFRFSDHGRMGIKKYIRRFGFPEVYDAAMIAFGKYDNWEVAFSKIGGICYNKAKMKEGQHGE